MPTATSDTILQSSTAETGTAGPVPYLWWIDPALAGVGAADAIFESYWQMPREWVEKPNRRRGGWSGVSRHVLDDGQVVFLKRLENHCYRDPRRLGRLTPTFRREWRASRRLAALGIAVPEILLYAERRVAAGGLQAIMVTRALEGYRTLPCCLREAGDDGAVRRALVETAADGLVSLHGVGFQHSCMAGKHLLLREGAAAQWKLVMLDLEKARRYVLLAPAAVRDLADLLQHTPELTPAERKELVGIYCRNWSARRRISLERAIVRRLIRKRHADRAAGLDGSA